VTREAGFNSPYCSAEHGFTPQCRSDEHGFTIVELLVSLLIFGMLAAAGVALLSFSVRAQDAASTRMQDLSEVRRASAIMTADFAQAAARLPRDERGDVRQAFEGSGGTGGELVTLVRRGWENFDNANRASIQKVEYVLEADRLERRAWRFVDGAEPMPPVTMLEGVTGVRLRYRDREGAWRDRWDPQRLAELPRAVEWTIVTRTHGTIVQLFLVEASL
jgi:general secretion pathway protein J